MDKNVNANSIDTMQQVSSFKNFLEQIQPVHFEVPLINVAAMEAVNKHAIMPEEIQTTINMMQNILPDMSVLNSISETMSVLKPIFDTVQGIIECMTPLWKSGYIHTINPEVVWSCMKNEDAFKNDLSEEKVDIKSFTADVTELIESDDPDKAVIKFQNKWKRIAKAAFGAITWITLIIASGKAQYELQPKYKSTPHITCVTEQLQDNGMNNNEVEFSVFCVENVAAKLGLSGDKVYQLLIEDKDILDEYIIPNYEMLHTQDKEYIVNDIIDYMKECGVLK